MGGGGEQEWSMEDQTGELGLTDRCRRTPSLPSHHPHSMLAGLSFPIPTFQAFRRVGASRT
eukprot:2186585-Rhodomonas_salina.1